MSVTDSFLYFVPVVPGSFNGNYRISYDEPNAVYERDRNNARLNDCPPPFSRFGSRKLPSGVMQSNSMALADMNDLHKMSVSYFEQHCSIIDNGATTISSNDMERVKNHPWPKQKQAEKRRLHDLPLDVSVDMMEYDGYGS